MDTVQRGTFSKDGSFISPVYQNLWIASKFTRTMSI